MIGLSIREILLNDPGVSQIVGSRISLDRSPQPAFDPSIVLWVESEQAFDALDGPLGMDNPRVRVVCYASNRPAAIDLRAKVRLALAGFIGVVGGHYIKGISQGTQKGESYESDRVKVGSDQYRFSSVQDFEVFYDYTVAT